MPGAPAPGAGPSTLKITPQSVEQGLHLQPPQVPQLKRIVVAGMKVMFSQQSHGLMVKQLQGPGPIAQKLATGIAGLMGLLMKESQNSIPPQLIIPAAMVLLAHAAEYAAHTTPVTDQDVGQAMTLMVHMVLKASGLDPAKVQAAGARGMAQAQGGSPAAAQPGAAPQPGAM